MEGSSGAQWTHRALGARRGGQCQLGRSARSDQPQRPVRHAESAIRPAQRAGQPGASRLRRKSGVAVSGPECHAGAWLGRSRGICHHKPLTSPEGASVRMLQRPLRLGTRRSLLARAQSSAIARRLEQLHPGLKVELVGIDTRGDRITSTPLSQVDGKEFFTAEIDAALRAGDVDLTVHSYKDLSLERPADLHLGAVPARENPRDLVYCAADVPERLASGATLRIGSSSPRRQAFVPSFLERALPHAPRVELCELRGNVDTRLRRLREPRSSERQLDGVILAFAGLSRLWQDEAVGAAALLHELLAGLPRMLLPLTLCSTAPAQGALAIECRNADLETRALLAAIDDPATRAGIGVERALLAERGGGCHQRFGATQLQVEGLGPLLYLREAGEQGPMASEVRWSPPAGPRRPLQPWDGSLQPAPALEPLPGRAAARGPAGPPPEAMQLWWHSGVQFERWGAQAPGGCQHACGPGKTAEALRRRGVQDLTVFPSVQHWREWLRT